MQVKQVKSEKLKREYQVTVPAKTIDQQVAAKLAAVGKDAKLPGFRPGKVPAQVIKKNYGQRVMGEVLDNVVRTSSQEALAKEGVRPALQPKIELIGEFAEGKDLLFKMELEVLPEVPEAKFDKITIERPKVIIAEKEVTKALERIAGQAKEFKAVSRAAKTGDAVLIDFKGFVDGEAFAGGEAKGHQLELGSNNFIEGFEEQLVGTKAGDAKKVKVTFPKPYHSDDLAGKPAVFEVTVHEVQESAPQEINDGLAKKLGFEDLAKVKDAVQSQIEREVADASRAKCKKQLFDQLDTIYTFDIPEQMTKMEFDSVWKQVQEARKAQPDSPEFKGKSEKELEAEYQKMAERRVRLGILLADIGAKQKIKVSQDELLQAAIAEARRYPGQEKQVFEVYQKNPQYVEMLRGPILEEKVVDFILEKVSVKDKVMTLEELQKSEDDAAAGVKGEKGEGKKPASKKKEG